MIDVTRDGAVCVLTLRREERLNALSAELERALRASLERDEVRKSGCVVFTGGAFSAGADVNEIGGSAEDVIAYYRETGDVYERVAALPQPTVSAIAGYWGELAAEAEAVVVAWDQVGGSSRPLTDAERSALERAATA